MNDLLIVRCGAAASPISARVGDYPRWFTAALPARIRFTALAPFDGDLLPTSWDGAIILTGSSASVRDEAPWMDEVGAWAVDRANSGSPVLGVCFGHQLLAEALGGRVEENPAGPEHGTVSVDLSPDADRLFAGLTSPVRVQQSHGDAVVGLPPGARLLASNATVACQSFAFGPRIRGVQFHPEMTREHMDAVLAHHDWEGLSEVSTVGPRILRNWVDTW